MSKAHALVRVGGFTAVWMACAAAIAAPEPQAGMRADQALRRLVDGNQRYVKGALKACAASNPGARSKLATGQQPYAIVLSCSDSRVPPELVFDEGLGELFVVRVAGNVPDPVVLGSIEYAAEHLGSSLIVVLGHERCGAVTAAVDAKGKPEGNLGSILVAIEPAVKRAKAASGDKPRAELVEAAVVENVKLVADNLTKQSPVLKKMVAAGKLKIIAARYDLDDGTVTVLDEGGIPTPTPHASRP